MKQPIETPDEKDQDTSDLLLECFSKKRTHKEIVQRTEQVLRLFMTLNELSDDDREAIWKTTDYNDFEMRIEMLKTLQGAAPDMKYEDRIFFMNKLLAIPLDKIHDREIDLVTAISSYGKEDERSVEISKVGLEFMWKLAFEGDPLEEEQDDQQI